MADANLASMTGYAALDGQGDGLVWQWDMRSVNGRGLDLRLRIPDGLGSLEAPLRALMQRSLKRGNVTVVLKVVRGMDMSGINLDTAELDAVLAALAEVENRSGGRLAPSNAADILALRGVLDSAGTAKLPDISVLMAEAEQLLEAFLQMRQAEGMALAEVLQAQLARISDLTLAAAETATVRSVATGERLKRQIKNLLDTADGLDEARLAQELALLAVKADVTEELDRLRTHVQAARDLIEGGGPIGRKLDFLMQEFNREANTLCSKSGDAGLTAIGLDLKLTIDQMREQVQNVE